MNIFSYQLPEFLHVSSKRGQGQGVKLVWVPPLNSLIFIYLFWDTYINKNPRTKIKFKIPE